MKGPGGITEPGPQVATAKCLICEKPIEGQKTFTCRRCSKSPFCLDHLDREYKMCSGCGAEERIRVYGYLVSQERSLRGFLRFSQFVFVLAVLFFAFNRFFDEHIPDFLKGSVFFEYALYLGGAAAGGMAFCYLLILSQKQKMKEVQDKIQSHKTDSRYMFR
jgi:ribosomal protein L37E